MKTITEEARQIPVCAETDVLVVGGGLAGVAAAAAASRTGANVILIEKSIILGGLATLGHVCVYLPLDDGLGHKIYGGMAEELLHVCIKYGFNNLPDCWRDRPDYVRNPCGRYSATFNIPACVLALDEFLLSENVDVIFDTNFCSPIMEGDTCRGVIVENKSGRTAYLAKTVVDASGDADVLYRAGAECETQKNIISHWAYETDLERMKLAVDSGDIRRAFNLRWLGLRPDVDNTSNPLPQFYGTTSKGVNDYIRVSRSLALDFLKKEHRDDYTMMSLPLMPQFRMTRRLKGMEDVVFVPGVHSGHSIGCVAHCLEYPAKIYEFPYEGLIDSRITNIAAAGRIVSAGGYGWEVMRCIPACVATGQAAGTAAAMAAKSGQALQEVDVAALQRKLADTGVMIHMYDELKKNADIKPGKRPPRSDILAAKTDSLSYEH